MDSFVRRSIWTIFNSSKSSLLASLDKTLAWGFSTRGICTSSNFSKLGIKLVFRYAAMLLSLAIKLLLTWLTASYKSLLARSLLTCISLANYRPAKRASYSVALFKTLNPNLMVQFSLCLFGLSSTTLGLDPTFPYEPSTKRLHITGSTDFIIASTPGALANFAIESTKAWPLIVLRGLNDRSNLLSSTVHFSRRPEVFGFWSTFFNGKLVNTSMEWAWSTALTFLTSDEGKNKFFHIWVTSFGRC